MLTFTILLLGLSAPTTTGVARPTAPEPVDLYRRCVTRSLERAQAELLDSTELWKDHSRWENAWVARSQNYEVRTTISRKFAVDTARGLDTMLASFKNVLQSDYVPTEPFKIFVFGTMAEYNQFGDDFGEEHSSFYGSFFPPGHPERAVGSMYTQNPTQMQMWITHSALHQFLERAYTTQPPLWISEGLASYFTLFWDYKYGISELSRIARNEARETGQEAGPTTEFVPLRDLMQAPIAGYADRTHNRFIELGMLFTYLLSYREDTRTVIDGRTEVQAPFAEYLRLVLGGGDATSAPVHELLTTRLDELESEFRAFDFGS